MDWETGETKLSEEVPKIRPQRSFAFSFIQHLLHARIKSPYLTPKIALGDKNCLHPPFIDEQVKAQEKEKVVGSRFKTRPVLLQSPYCHQFYSVKNYFPT